MIPSTSPSPPLESCGFVRVPQPAGPALWMTCNACGKSDHFWMADDRVRCRCGASYDHAVRPDGSEAPLAVLTWVPFAEGPKHLADLEWDPRRIAIVGFVAIVALGVLAGLGLALFGPW